MAAYAALTSLMTTVDDIQNHPCPPISLDNDQVESLTEKVTFLQEFLEGYSRVGYSKEADPLESRIVNVAYAAEDVIESNIVDRVLAGSTSHGEKISSVDLYPGLHKVIQDMDFIKKEAMEIKEKMGVPDQPHGNSSSFVGSSRPAFTEQNSVIVGLDDVLYEMKDKLIGNQPDRQILSIVGMGGIGKTTLARIIYQDEVVVHHFDIRVWVTISQEYTMKEILLTLSGRGANSNQEREYELEGELHKTLSGRRYLIVMDDIWHMEVWDQLKLFFPENNNGSRIMLTTRLSNLASQLSGSHGFQMDFLDENESWTLLCKHVFGKEGCPPEMEEIGKNIARNCKGLPLSIVVIGGLLAKSKRKRKYWQYTLENLNSVVNLDDNERGLQILYMSYNNLPVHLKPCFLYIGGLREDARIKVPKLIDLWSAEGFLKPVDGKSLKKVAKEYFQELVDRNLILVDEFKYNGKPQWCTMHDLLRDLCLREARKLKFFYVLGKQSTPNIQQDINTERRIFIHKSTQREKDLAKEFHARSLILPVGQFSPSFPVSGFRFLRVYSEVSPHDPVHPLEQVNLRYLDVSRYVIDPYGDRFPFSTSLLWNLQTLTAKCVSWTTPHDIWKMPQLRHIDILPRFELPDPPKDATFVLEKLQTLMHIRNFKCGEEVVKRIPNLKKLVIWYSRESHDNYYTNNLVRLSKLESLEIYVEYSISTPRDWGQNLTFPHSLEKLTLCCTLTFPYSLGKLTLYGTRLHWEDLTTKVGSLPLLRVLKLLRDACTGPEWKTVEGQFRSLKFLEIRWCEDLEYWTTESSHFPQLEYLVLEFLRKLKDSPSEIGEISTLQYFRMYACSKFASISAKRMQVEQEELGNVGLQFHISRNRDEFEDKDEDEDEVYEVVDKDEDEDEGKDKKCFQKHEGSFQA